MVYLTAFMLHNSKTTSRRERPFIFPNPQIYQHRVPEEPL